MSADGVKHHGKVAARQQYFPAPLSSLTSDTLELDLYLLHDLRGEPTLYRSAGLAFSRDDARRLEKTGVKFVYVPLAQHAKYRRMLLDRTNEAFYDPDVALKERGKIVRETCGKLIEDVLQFPGWDGAVDAVRDISALFGEWSDTRPDEFSYVLDMTAHDFYTTTHMVNVGVACGMLARELKRDDPDLIRQMMEGGFLHDIGKRGVPEEILNKEGKLTDNEWAILRMHPTKGYEELRKKEGIPRVILEMTRDHHEKLDGSGYPNGIKGEAISFAARVCAIVDIYDALTTARPYRGPVPPAKVLQMMREDIPLKIDADIFAVWESMIQRLLREDPSRSFGSRLGSVATVSASGRSANAMGPHFGDDKRRFPRRSCRLLGQAIFEYRGKAVGPETGVWFPVGVTDISQGGVGMRFEFAPSRGDILRVRITPGSSHSIERAGEVVRVRQLKDGAWGVGLRFTELVAAAA